MLNSLDMFSTSDFEYTDFEYLTIGINNIKLGNKNLILSNSQIESVWLAKIDKKESAPASNNTVC